MTHPQNKDISERKGRYGRVRQSTLLIPRQTRAAGSGEAGSIHLGSFREALGRPGFANKAGNFFTIGLKGAFMKLALTVATLIALGGGTAYAQQGQLSLGQRDLTPEEQQVIMDAVAPSLRNPRSAKYHWAKFPAVVTEGSVNYCAIVRRSESLRCV